jgi:uncharacterized protein (DUF433 family)
MTLTIGTEQMPMRRDPDGTIRIGRTRVTLDCVAAAFEQGATAETIVEQFPTLELPDVYLVLGYYLRHTQDILEYLAEGRQLAAQHRQRTESRLSPHGLRERLLARHGSGK